MAADRFVAPPPFAGELKKRGPRLARVLEPLSDDYRLSLEVLNQRAAPGLPLDDLALFTVILEYLRQDRP